MSLTYGERFVAALVSEIKAEMGRRDLSSRGLGRLIGKSSQYMSDRLDGGNSKTGRRVGLSAQDLAVISEALGIKPDELTYRAHFAALGEHDFVAEIAGQARGNVTHANFGTHNNDAPDEKELSFDDIDHVETTNIDDLGLAAKRGTRKADDLPHAE